MTLDDDVVFDTHRRTGRCVHPRSLGLVVWAVWGVGCWPGSGPKHPRSAALRRSTGNDEYSNLQFSWSRGRQVRGGRAAFRRAKVRAA